MDQNHHSEAPRGTRRAARGARRGRTRVRQWRLVTSTRGMAIARARDRASEIFMWGVFSRGGEEPRSPHITATAHT